MPDHQQNKIPWTAPALIGLCFIPVALSFAMGLTPPEQSSVGTEEQWAIFGSKALPLEGGMLLAFLEAILCFTWALVIRFRGARSHTEATKPVKPTGVDGFPHRGSLRR